MIGCFVRADLAPPPPACSQSGVSSQQLVMSAAEFVSHSQVPAGSTRTNTHTHTQRTHTFEPLIHIHPTLDSHPAATLFTGCSVWLLIGSLSVLCKQLHCDVVRKGKQRLAASQRFFSWPRPPASGGSSAVSSERRLQRHLLVELLHHQTDSNSKPNCKKVYFFNAGVERACGRKPCAPRRPGHVTPSSHQDSLVGAAAATSGPVLIPSP